MSAQGMQATAIATFLIDSIIEDDRDLRSKNIGPATTKVIRAIADAMLHRPVWISFGERLPKVMTNPRGDIGYQKVLVTNNLGARDAFGELSHVWLTGTLLNDDARGWFAYSDGLRISYLTHWLDPFGGA